MLKNRRSINTRKMHKYSNRNRRASNHRSHLSFVPLEELFPGRNDLPVYKHPTVEPSYEQRLEFTRFCGDLKQSGSPINCA